LKRKATLKRLAEDSKKAGDIAARTAASQWLYNPWLVDRKQKEISTTIDVEVK
jgi:hypothetical protein